MKVSEDKLRKEVSVILPTYNERENIGCLIQEIFKNIPRETEIIVVDDDSPDGTWRVVEEMARMQKDILLVRRAGNKGLASALNEGIALSRGEIVIWLDCDFSMPPSKIRELLEDIDRGYDVVVGSRYIEGGGVEIITGSRDSLFAHVLSSLLNRFIQRVLGFSFKDYTSGFIAIKRKVLEGIRLRGDYGEYFVDLIYRMIKKRYRVKEIPYVSKARRKGISKTGTNLFHYLARGSRYIFFTIKLKFTKIEKD